MGDIIKLPVTAQAWMQTQNKALLLAVAILAAITLLMFVRMQAKLNKQSNIFSYLLNHLSWNNYFSRTRLKRKMNRILSHDKQVYRRKQRLLQQKARRLLSASRASDADGKRRKIDDLVDVLKNRTATIHDLRKRVERADSKATSDAEQSPPIHRRPSA